MLCREFGQPLKPAHRNDLMEIMDDRHGQTSTLVISQLPIDQWYTSIGDNTLADAILDRLMQRTPPAAQRCVDAQDPRSVDR